MERFTGEKALYHLLFLDYYTTSMPTFQSR